MNDHDEIARARQAQELLDNPVLRSALTAIETEIFGMWRECKLHDAQGQEALLQLLKTTDKFKAILHGYINTGQLAKDNLARFEGKPRTFMDRLRAV
jgi:hypothetical protein